MTEAEALEEADYDVELARFDDMHLGVVHATGEVIN